MAGVERDATRHDGIAGNHLPSILSSARIGIWNWDLASDAVTWSTAQGDEDGHVEILMPSVENLVALAESSDRPELRDALERCRTKGEAVHHQFRYELADGELGRLLIDGVCTGGRPPTSVVGISRDDTDQLRIEVRLSRLFEERDLVARALETALLPPVLPDVPGLAIDSDYLSSEGAATGDFYDLFPLGKRHWGMTIGDVGGHGPAAAAVTAAIRYSLRAAALVEKSTTRVLHAANEAQLAATHDERFTTCHFIRTTQVGEGQFELRVATAGHPALLIRRAAGQIEELAGTGPMLGMHDQPEYTEATTELLPGDTVLAYTDGVTEARRGNNLFGEDRLKALLSDWEGPIKGLSRAVHLAARRFADGEVQDDMATVVLRVTDQPTS